MPKTYNQLVQIEQPQVVSLKAIGFKAGLSRTKGWFQRVFVGWVPQFSRDGALALVEIVIKRANFGNRYSEKVTMKQTGEVIHHCEEPLDQHQGHGSDKRRGSAPEST